MFGKIIKRLIPFHKKETYVGGWDKAKFEKVKPVADEVFNIMAKCDFPYSDKDNWESVSKAIHQPVKDILELYLKNNLLLEDLKLVSVMIKSKIDRIEQSVAESLNNSSEIIEESLYGCPKRELDFETLDRILREIYTIKEETK